MGGAESAPQRAAQELDILVLGGTGFVGPHQIGYALDRGHRVTTFNRGPLLPAPAADTEDVSPETYGPLKAECDRIVQQLCGEQAMIVRPTYIVGPDDTTDRVTYWVERFYRGSGIVCPSRPEQEASWIDVRDLCHWLVRFGENDTPGTFNDTGPASPITREGLMHGLRACTARAVTMYCPTAAEEAAVLAEIRS